MPIAERGATYPDRPSQVILNQRIGVNRRDPKLARRSVCERGGGPPRNASHATIRGDAFWDAVSPSSRLNAALFALGLAGWVRLLRSAVFVQPPNPFSASCGISHRVSRHALGSADAFLDAEGVEAAAWPLQPSSRGGVWRRVLWSLHPPR